MQPVRVKHTIGVFATESELCRQYQPSTLQFRFQPGVWIAMVFAMQRDQFCEFLDEQAFAPEELMKNLIERCYSLFHPKCQFMRNLQEKSLTSSAGRILSWCRACLVLRSLVLARPYW